jgi:DNA modification methylase
MRREILADGVDLYLGDCREILPTLGDQSVDMIWTDPPYGHSNHDGDFNARLNEHRGIESKPIAFDDADGMRNVVDAMLKEAARVLRADCCCCCCCCCGGGGPRPTFAWVADRMDRDGLSFFHSVIWDKVNPGLGWRYRRQHEMVMVSHRQGGKLLWNDTRKAVSNIYSLMPPRDRQHPNEKPLEMVRHFIENHSSPGHTVLDPFMGGGTTGAAAVACGRNFIGIELDPEHFETALRRISDALARPDLFIPSPAPKAKQEAMDL